MGDLGVMERGPVQALEQILEEESAEAEVADLLEQELVFQELEQVLE